MTALETRLHDELYYLRTIVQDLLPRNSYYNQPRQGYYQDNYYPTRPSYNPPSRHPISSQSNYHHNNVQKIYSDESRENGNATATITIAPTETIFTAAPLNQPEVVNVMRNKLKSLESNKSRASKPTVQPTSSSTQVPFTTITDHTPAKNEYTYYWKLENFPKVFIHAKKNEIFSHVFNVKGLFLRIRAMLRHFDDQNLILDIEHLANIENVDKMGIEISDGLVFQEIAEEKLFQYSFAIMDQTKPNHDLISPIYWNTDTDNFLVPNSVHLLANYVKNNSILIKLIIIF